MELRPHVSAGVGSWIRWAAPAVILMAAPPAQADPARDQVCLKWARQLQVEAELRAGTSRKDAEAHAALLTPEAACETLATNLADEPALQATSGRDLVKAEDVQPLVGPGSGAQGTAVQPGASPSSLPTPLAAANLGLAGTPQGPQTVVSLAVNPFSLFADSMKGLAAASRAGDLSITVPVNLNRSSTDAMAPKDAVEGFGVRLRLNVNGLLATTHDKAVAVYTMLSRKEGARADRIQVLLEAATDLSACVEALRGTGSIVAACGRPLITDDDLPRVRAQARELLRQVRAEADRFYLGLDARGDFGKSPFLEAGQRGTFLTVGGAAGWRQPLAGARAFFAARLRLAGAYADPDDPPGMTIKGKTKLDYGFALEFGGILGLRTMGLNAGIEGRTGPKDPVADTGFADLRIGFNVPTSDQGNASVAISVPLRDGTHSTTVSVSGDWSMLLGALQSVVR